MTKGQKTALERIQRMYGKVYPEPSLKAEIGRIMGAWDSRKSKFGVVLSSNICGMAVDVSFRRIGKHTFTLNTYRVKGGEPLFSW